MNHKSLSLEDKRISVSQSNKAEFIQAIFELLTNKLSGHMERWEYGAAEYPGDPAAGSVFWAEFIRKTNSYYLLKGEEYLIKEAIKSGKVNILNSLRTVVELGPGSKDAINKKTLPFLSACTDLSSYIAVDSETEQAKDAVRQIHAQYNKLNTHSLAQDFESFSLNIPRLGPTGLIMWGCTFGNIPGQSKSDPFDHLLKSFKRLRDSINAGDHLFITFDTEEREECILNAYNHPLLSACFLSPLYRLARDYSVTGHFDPDEWKHESIWIPETLQCAHIIYPTENQEFELCGTKISIPKNKKLITNNSYKFSKETIISAAKKAGLVPELYENDPMILLIARRP